MYVTVMFFDVDADAIGAAVEGEAIVDNVGCVSIEEVDEKSRLSVISAIRIMD